MPELRKKTWLVKVRRKIRIPGRAKSSVESFTVSVRAKTVRGAKTEARNIGITGKIVSVTEKKK